MPTRNPWYSQYYFTPKSYKVCFCNADWCRNQLQLYKSPWNSLRNPLKQCSWEWMPPCRVGWASHPLKQLLKTKICEICDRKYVYVFSVVVSCLWRGLFPLLSSINWISCIPLLQTCPAGLTYLCEYMMTCIWKLRCIQSPTSCSHSNVLLSRWMDLWNSLLLPAIGEKETLFLQNLKAHFVQTQSHLLVSTRKLSGNQALQ